MIQSMRGRHSWILTAGALALTVVAGLLLARLGPEAVDSNLEPGDRIRVEYLVGTAVKVTRVVPS